MAHRFIIASVLAGIFLALYFLGFISLFALRTWAFILFVLTGAICMFLLPDEWKTYGFFLFGVGIVLIVV
jgi:hypothetical protein